MAGNRLLTSVVRSIADPNRPKAPRYQRWLSRRLPDLGNILCRLEGQQVVVTATWSILMNYHEGLQELLETVIRFKLVGSVLMGMSHRAIYNRYKQRTVRYIRLPNLELLYPDSDPAKHVVQQSLSEFQYVQEIISAGRTKGEQTKLRAG